PVVTIPLVTIPLVTNPTPCGLRRCRTPWAPRPRCPLPTGSRAYRSGSARWRRPRGAGGGPCSRQCGHGSRPGSPPRLDDARPPLAPTLVGRADHDGVEDVRVGAHRGLHLLGEDLLAPRIDGHRSSAQQGDGAVLLDGGEVARHHVALAFDVDEDLGGLDGIVVVADRDVPRSGDLADGARSDRKS